MSVATGKITVLMPCRDQLPEYLAESIGSVVSQTSPNWTLLVCVDDDTPSRVTDYVLSYADARVKVVVNQGHGLAGAINTGMAQADTDFVCILLSDDRLTPTAIEVLQRYILKNPDIDYFHSARRLIDADGRPRGKVMPARTEITLEYFAKNGSPVKHLMAWRRPFALAAGGLDERLTVHGCDDYDFPWCMAEAGARFQAIQECLYEYRVHRRHFRLTTDVPLAQQEAVLRAMFTKHGVSQRATEDYLRRAKVGYLVKETLESFEEPLDYRLSACRFYQADSTYLKQFGYRGWESRHLFQHRLHYLAKPGPDGHKLAIRHHGKVDPGNLHQLLLYAEEAELEGLPDQLFFDPDLNWHQQHYLRRGLIGYADFMVVGTSLYVHVYCSDLVQRISRYREYKTRIERQFLGWNRLLLHGLLHFAREHGVRDFYSIGSDEVLRNVDAQRTTQAELFSRVYDRSLQRELQATRRGKWWHSSVGRLCPRVVPLPVQTDWIHRKRTICLCHDLERGWGHRSLDAAFSEKADRSGLEVLKAMLSIEGQFSLKATYQIVGKIFGESRELIESQGHCLAFHSFDHQIPPQDWKSWLRELKSRFFPPAVPLSFELGACRELDYRLKGYRPPQSRLTQGLLRQQLSYYNFEWLASSASSLGHRLPKLERGVVRIPIHTDDYGLYLRAMSYDEWEARLLDEIERSTFYAFCLHDCYAHLWLPNFTRLLAKLQALGDFQTLDQVAAEVTLAAAR